MYTTNTTSLYKYFNKIMLIEFFKFLFCNL